VVIGVLQGVYCDSAVRDMAAVCGSFLVMPNFSIASSALTMTRCSAWFLEHFLSNLNFICAASSFPAKIATPDPTPCSLLLPSVYTWSVRSLFSLSSIILTASAG